MDGNDLISKYELYLSRLPISVHTRRNYLLRVRLYLEWLEQSPDSAAALTDPKERDFAVQDPIVVSQAREQLEHSQRQSRRSRKSLPIYRIGSS